MTEKEIISAVFKYTETIINEPTSIYKLLIYDYVMNLKKELLTKDFDAHKNINFDVIYKMFR